MMTKNYLENESLYKSFEFFLPGWKSPVIVDYTIVKMYNRVYMVWYVNKVQFPFKIEYKKLLQEDGSNYINHFSKVLTLLRNDLINWYNEGLPEDFMKEYYNLFKEHILF